MSHCGSQTKTVAYQQDQVPHALRENPSYQLQYLNCTLTVSSNKHVGLLEKKKTEEALSEPAIAFFFFPIFLDEAAEKLFLS